jgi:hypothetical protein
VVLAIEMGIYYWHTGDPLFRIKSIVISTGGTAEPNPGRMYRNDFFIYPYYWFVSLYHFGFFYYFILVAFGYALWNKLKQSYIPILWAVSLFLYLQFGREGKYLIHKEARFLSIITIPCLLVLGYVLTHYSFRKKARRRFFWVVIIFLGLSSLFFTSFKQTIYRNEIENLRMTVRYLRQIPEYTEVYTDNSSAKYLNYFFGFTEEPSIKVFNIHNYQTGQNTFPVDLATLHHNALVIVNWPIIQDMQSKLKLIQYPEILSSPPENWTLIRKIQPPEGWIYESLRLLRNSPFLAYLPKKFSRKLTITFDSILKNTTEEILIYAVTA